MVRWIVMLLGAMLVAGSSRAQELPGLEVQAGDREVALTWQAAAIADLSHYELYRSVYNGYIRLDRETTSFTDTGLENGVTYFYALVAVNMAGNKREIAGRTAAMPLDLPPASPTGFKASGRNEEVRLRWSMSDSKDLAGYMLFRSTEEQPLAENTAPVAVLDKTDSVYIDQGLTNETIYTYHLFAVDDTGHRSEAVRDQGVPGFVPEGLTARPGDQSVRLSWDANTHPGMSHYVLYRSNTPRETPGQRDMLARIDINDSTYTDTGLIDGVSYYYYLTLVEEHGYSNIYVEPVVAVPQDLPPVAPSGLHVTVAVRDAAIEWVPNPEPDVVRYYLYRSMNSRADVENGVPIAQAGAADTAYVDPGLEAGTTYYYFLIAEDDSGQRSPRSPQVSATIPEPRYKTRDLTFFLLATQFFLVPLAIAF